jgi:hypothetical protein
MNHLSLGYTPLLLPDLWRAALSHKPEKLRQHPSSKDMASVERVEGYVGISVARLAVGSECHSKRSAYPSPLPLQIHVQIEETDLPRD